MSKREFSVADVKKVCGAYINLAEKNHGWLSSTCEVCKATTANLDDGLIHTDGCSVLIAKRLLKECEE